jgi:hypothetical protein
LQALAQHRPQPVTLPTLEADVLAARLTPTEGARRLLALLDPAPPRRR